jgi:hypothetical protein
MRQIPSSLLYSIATVLSVPNDYFFDGLEGFIKPKNYQHRPLSPRLQQVLDAYLHPDDDGRSQREVVRLIAAYWNLPGPDERRAVLEGIKRLARRTSR